MEQENTATLLPAGARTWMPPPDRMPPIVQFAWHVARWCRSRCATAGREDAPLRLVSQLALGAKRHLALVEVGGAQFLVGGGAEHVTVIVPVAAEPKADAGALRGEVERIRVQPASARKEPMSCM